MEMIDYSMGAFGIPASKEIVEASMEATPMELVETSTRVTSIEVVEASLKEKETPGEASMEPSGEAPIHGSNGSAEASTKLV